MTEIFDWNPMPHKLDVKCPKCGSMSEFEFAEIVRIELKKDVEFFINSNVFEYQMFSDSCGHRWHGAIYFAGLHGEASKAIHSLPEGYCASSWEHSKYLLSSHSTLGSVRCKSCQYRSMHVLNWPQDAYFSIEIKGQVLWAFNTDSAMDLRAYIDSKDRRIRGYKYSSFLLHVPTYFKKQNVRKMVTKKLDRLLGNCVLTSKSR